MAFWNRKRKDEPQASEGSSSTVELERKRKLRDKLNDKNRWYWKFAQQRLPGWAPILTANGVVLYFFCVCIFCVALGVPILTASLGVKEYSVRYDDAGTFAGLSRDQQQQQLLAANGAGVPVTVELTIVERMEPPVFVFYELHSYYQNHKRYVRSRSDNQLGGEGGASSACSPQQYVNGSANPALPNNGEINPCGLIAWSFFNDTFSVSTAGSSVNVNDSSIAWAYDSNHLYGSVEPQNFNIYPDKRGGNTSQMVVNENQHLMVWLKPAAQPSFRKNWGRIDQALLPGTVLQISVQNRYDTYRWGGQKRFVVSTNSWVGGKNLFLGIIYLVVAGLALLACLAFLICYHLGLVGRRKFGDLSHLSWNRKQ